MLHAPPAQPHPPEGILQFPCEQGDSSECVCTEGLNDENNFFIVFESHSGHVTSSCFPLDLCKTSNFVLHEEHLYSNTGITLIRNLFFYHYKYNKFCRLELPILFCKLPEPLLHPLYIQTLSYRILTMHPL